MNETTFEHCSVGDKAYYLDMEGKVTCINHESLFPIIIKLHHKECPQSFTYGGCEIIGDPQTLFWQPVTVTPPPRPKRMVKKVLDYWTNHYGTSDCGRYVTEQEADEAAVLHKRLGKAHHIIHEYEVEE